jgi:hypothetical protein
MIGREQEPPDKKATRKNAIDHKDQIATELARKTQKTPSNVFS